MSQDKKDEFILKMEADDTRFCEELDAIEAELAELFVIDKLQLHTCLIRAIGNMQRYNDKLVRYKLKKNKIKRYKIQLYARLYNNYKFKSSIGLKTQHEYDTWISKDTNFARCESYIFTIDSLIAYHDQAIKNFSSMVFAIQSMLKSKEFETGPSFNG
jgi:hypothetical protein